MKIKTDIGQRKPNWINPTYQKLKSNNARSFTRNDCRNSRNHCNEKCGKMQHPVQSMKNPLQRFYYKSHFLTKHCIYNWYRYSCSLFVSCSMYVILSETCKRFGRFSAKVCLKIRAER